MDLLLPDRFEDPGTAYAYGRLLFAEVAAGVRPATLSIMPSIRHVGVTRRDTLRTGFDEAVRAAHEEGYPVLVRGAGGAPSPPTRAPSASPSSVPPKTRDGV